MNHQFLAVHGFMSSTTTVFAGLQSKHLARIIKAMLRVLLPTMQACVTREKGEPLLSVNHRKRHVHLAETL